MRLSVVIASKDRSAFLERTLESLALQVDPPSFEVVVADNGSTDNTADIVEARRKLGTFPLNRVFVARPNRAQARNAGMYAASGEIVVFVDDDVWLPEHFLRAHAAAHTAIFDLCVSGPILNVASYAERPRPTGANYSRAFLCTCNASVPLASLRAIGGFDEQFDRYGWEDTELGLRLRATGIHGTFSWDAFLYHIKPPAVETLAVRLRKKIEMAQMAVRLLDKHAGVRARLATGAHPANLVRSRIVAPSWLLPVYAAAAEDERLPRALRCVACAQLLDGVYAQELRRAIAARRGGQRA